MVNLTTSDDTADDLAAGWQREGELGLDPPPLLVVEIASRSTRDVDRTRKLADYRLGGARMYLLLDPHASLEANDLTTGKWSRRRARSTWSSAAARALLAPRDPQVSVDLTSTGYTVDDLDWLRDEIGVAHLELDPWGSLIVSPATDEQELAMTLLHEQALR